MQYRKKMKVLMTIFVFAMALSACGNREDNNADEPVSVPEMTESPLSVGNSETNSGTDVVLVMDESGSMLGADKERLAIEAAKLFVDMEKASGASIGLVEFSNQISATGLMDTSQQQNKDYIKEILSAVKYVAKAHTDTGAGLLEAVSALESAEAEHDKVIVLFTDGKTDIDAGTPGRTIEDSVNDVNSAIQIAKERGYRIYCIGLNADGKVDEEMLRNIAVTTGGEYKIATDVNELPDFFNAIFANMDQSTKQDIDEYDADGDYREVHFEIDNSSVMEANIVILSSGQLDDVNLTDPSGNPVSLEGSGEAAFSSSAKYSLVKLFYPTVGEWSIRVKGVSGDHIKVSLIYNYDVELAVDVQNAVVMKGQDVKVGAYFLSHGERITDQTIYAKLSGFVKAVNRNTGEVQQEVLELNKQGDALEGSFPTGDVALYDVSVHVEGSGFYRDSEIFTVEAVKTPPVQIKKIGRIRLKVGESRELDLTEYFQDEDGELPEFTVQKSVDFLKTETKAGTLLLNAEHTGEGMIQILVQNGSPESIQQEIEVEVISLMQTIGGIMTITAVVILAVLLLYFNSRRKRKLYGAFQVQILSAAKNAYGVFEQEEYSIQNTISVEALGKHGFTVNSLLKLLPGYYPEIVEEKKQHFKECLAKMEIESVKVKIVPGKKAFTLVLKNQSPNAKIVSMNNVSDRKELAIDLNENKYGSSSPEKEFGVRFINGEEFQQINFKYKKM